MSAILLQAEMFEQLCSAFPVEALNAPEGKSMLNKAKLKTE